MNNNIFEIINTKKKKVTFLKLFLIVVFPLFLIFSSTFMIFSSSKEGSSTKDPSVFRIKPRKAYVGEEITIYGNGFGSQKEKSKVYFGEVSCQDYDFDYIYWSDDVIKVKVPTGVQDGKITLKIRDNVIEGPFFHSKNENSHVYTDPINFTIDHSLNISSVTKNVNKSLYLWLPSAVPSDRQRDVLLMKASRNHLMRQDNELDLYKISSLYSNQDYFASKRFNFNNYQLETNIDADKVNNNYDKKTEFYKYYTSSQYAVESDDPRMIELAKSIKMDEKNPYLIAKLFYDWIVDNLEYQYPPPKRDWRALSALNTSRGDCAVYSFLFVALCRASGIPARPVAGHVVFKSDTVSMHFWAEFYIPKYGWVPVDVNYGDVQVDGFMPKEFYFGNMDNRHIAFSKGKVDLYLTEEELGKKKDITLKYLQKYHSYMKNKPKDVKYKVKRTIKRVL